MRAECLYKHAEKVIKSRSSLLLKVLETGQALPFLTAKPKIPYDLAQLYFNVKYLILYCKHVFGRLILVWAPTFFIN